MEIGSDVEIGRNVALRGRTRIADNVRIDDGVILTDTEVGAGSEIKPYCVAAESVIGADARIGPFAHLRPGTELGPDVHIGNFVETKKTRMGKGSKANHLSYLGDAVIGQKVNVGAGTITCNYNGYEKRQTIIEDDAFIGSDTQLVAPVRVGRRAVVAAGTTVTSDVPPARWPSPASSRKTWKGTPIGWHSVTRPNPPAATAPATRRAPATRTGRRVDRGRLRRSVGRNKVPITSRRELASEPGCFWDCC